MADEAWDADIAALPLSPIEKNGLQVYRNYSRSFDGHRAKKAAESASDVQFDFDGYKSDIEVIVLEPILTGVIAAISVADDLLADMFKRDKRPRLQMSSLLGPMGPLGDFNKRLKVAALAEFIDEDSLIFFDELRKVRNGIAHSRKPKNPTGAQIERVVDAAPHWLDAMVTHEKVSLPTINRQSEAVLKAAIVMHLSKLAWLTILAPLAKKAGVPTGALLADPPDIFNRISRHGVLTAMRLLTPPKDS